MRRRKTHVSLFELSFHHKYGCKLFIDNQLPSTLLRTLGRPPDRHNAIYEALVRRIVQGEFPPNSRLPTRRDLSLEFDASSRTVVSVLKELAKVGFTESRGSLGTFIRKSPPHLHRHALIIDWAGDPNIYVTALEKEAERLQREGLDLDVFHIGQDHKRTDIISKIGNLVRRHLYAGLIFHREPADLVGTALIDTPNVPRVVLSKLMYNQDAKLPSKKPTKDLFMERAIERIHQWGRSRVGLFLHAFESKAVEVSMELLRANKLETRSAWIHTIHLNLPREAHAVMELLFSLPRENRPDVFIVENDNLTEMVTLGVRDFCPSRENLPIISHCNYPWQPKVYAPVSWLGYDIREILRQAISMIEDERREGEARHTKIQNLPRFEEELLQW